ncbi:MAG: ubiquinone biosynthesis accessory factor UbiJ [Candidatus Wenzhouxiangella sp. M2_3B_020]
MSRYVTPFPGMLAGAIEFVLGRAAHLDEDPAAKLAPIEGRWIKFDLEGLGIELWLSADGPTPIVLAEPEPVDREPDAEISGTPDALLMMALPAFDTGGRIRIEGDARLVQKFQQAVRSLDPDVEKALTEYFGELLGPQIHRLVSDLLDSGRDAARTGGDQVAHWLRDESGLTPSRAEWHEFRDGVDELREAVDRLESRVRRKQR